MFPSRGTSGDEGSKSLKLTNNSNTRNKLRPEFNVVPTRNQQTSMCKYAYVYIQIMIVQTSDRHSKTGTFALQYEKLEQVNNTI